MAAYQGDAVVRALFSVCVTRLVEEWRAAAAGYKAPITAVIAYSDNGADAGAAKTLLMTFVKLVELLGLVCGVDVVCPPPMPPLEDMAIWASIYDPAYCYDEYGRVIRNINCDSDPSVMATSLPVADYYGIAAACMPDWIGYTLVVEGVGERPCLDTGPAIVPTFRVVYDPDEGFVERWVIVVDFLEHHDRPPDWQYGLFDEWRIE